MLCFGREVKDEYELDNSRFIIQQRITFENRMHEFDRGHGAFDIGSQRRACSYGPHLASQVEAG